VFLDSMGEFILACGDAAKTERYEGEQRDS